MNRRPNLPPHPALTGTPLQEGIFARAGLGPLWRGSDAKEGRVAACRRTVPQANNGTATSAGPTQPFEPRLAAFTLLELLVVVGLIAALSFVLIGGLGGGGKSAALQSAQATMANLVTAARVKAMASGQPARVLVCIDPNGATQPSRFLRYVALQVQVAGAWQLISEAYLPEGIYVVPGNFNSIPGGLFPTNPSTPWTRSDGLALRSTVLRNDWITTETIGNAVAEQWVSFSLSAAGTTAQAGDIVLAAGRRRASGSFAAGESPVELLSPEQVRGISLSNYGVPVLVNSRASF